jgi:hypothetical protein
MTVGGDWGIPPASLTIPPFAGPLDDSILIQAPPAGCLGTRYAAAIVWRQNSPVFRGQFFIGIVKSSLVVGGTTTWVERGFMLDSSPVCWIYVTGRWTSDFSPFPGNTFTETIGNVFTSVGAPAALLYLLDVLGDLRVTGAIDWNGSTSASQRENTAYTSASAAYTTVGSVTVLCGVSFVVPPNGRMLIHYGAFMSNNTAGNAALITMVIRDGSVIGSGTVVIAATDDNCVQSTNTAGNPDRQGVSYLFDTGTVGNTYNAYLEHRVNPGGTGSFDSRYVIATPAL